MRHLAITVLGMLLLGLSPRAVFAQSPDQQVEKGLGEFSDLEFAQAIASLEVVVDAPDATPSQRLLALELIAISHLSLRQTKKAEEAFERLLALRPEYELRNHDGSPKVIALFEAVKLEVVKLETVKRQSSKTEPDRLASKRVRLSWQGLPSAKAGKRMMVVVDAEGSSPTSMELLWKVRGDSEFEVAEMRRYKGSRWRAKIRLPAEADDYELAMFVEALGPAGEVVATLGDEASATHHRVSGRGSPSKSDDGAWYGSWKLWAGLGAATLLGGSVAILASGSDLREGSLSPGRITLSP
tara:strand:- start:6887 stop:7780 length:894 start_codon:yes stop_codon:yes gene_type:complete